MFEIVIVPSVQAVIDELEKRDRPRHRKVLKCFARLAEDPRYQGLHSHPFTALNDQFGQVIWESYVENQTPSAWRAWWFYGLAEGSITVVLLGPHP